MWFGLLIIFPVHYFSPIKRDKLPTWAFSHKYSLVKMWLSPSFSVSLHRLCRQTESESRVLVLIWGFEAGWAFGQPSVTRWWVGVKDQSGLTRALGRHVCLTAGAPPPPCMLLQSSREGRDDYLCITRVVKRLDIISVQEQCGMNHKDDFDLQAGCEDKSACTADLWF